MLEDPPGGGGAAPNRGYGRSVIRNRLLAGVLALATVVLAVGGEVMALTHTAGPAGLFVVAFAAPVGMTAWVVLGAPMTRSDLRH